MQQSAAVIGCVLGGIFAWVDLARKYSTTHKYLYRLASCYFYLLLSACGAGGVTYGLQALGVQFSEDPALNVGLTSLLGAGLFIGVISTLALPSTSAPQYGAQLKTIRDFVFDYLSASIDRKLTQRLEKEIRKLHRSILDKDRFYDEADLMLGGIAELTDDEKVELSAQFSIYASEGKYAAIIRGLTKYRDIDFIIQQLSDENILQDIWTDDREHQQAGKFLRSVRQMLIQFLKDEPTVTPEFCQTFYRMLHHRFGDYAAQNQHYDVAAQYYQQAFELAEDAENIEEQARYSGFLGHLALQQEQWSDASKWFFKEYSLTHETGHLALLAEAKAGLANVFRAENREQEARQWAQEALELYTTLHDDAHADVLRQTLADSATLPPEEAEEEA